MSDEQRLAEAKKIMMAFQKQTEMMQGNMIKENMQPNVPSMGQPGEFDNQGGGEFVQHGDGNSVGTGFDNQSENNSVVLQNINNKANVISSPNPPQPNISTKTAPQPIPQPNNISAVTAPIPSLSADVCPQCKTMHPPLNPGQKCPNMGLEDKVNEMGIDIDDATINKHLVDMRNIIISIMTAKQIKDGKKFFQYAVVELSKALELYESS